MSSPLTTFASLLFSGALLEFFSWPSIFALRVVLAALALVGTVAVVPTSRDSERGAIDPAGAAGWLMKALKLEDHAPRRDSGDIDISTHLLFILAAFVLASSNGNPQKLAGGEAGMTKGQPRDGRLTAW